jgi:hypothetical protein
VDIKDITMGQMMTTGRFADYRFSPKMISIFSDAANEEGYSLELAELRTGPEGDKHFNMPEDEEHISVVAWHEGSDSDEPGDCSIFMYRDPVTKKNRVIGETFDSHGGMWLMSII